MITSAVISSWIIIAIIENRGPRTNNVTFPKDFVENFDI